MHQTNISASVSTALWTGVYLADVLAHLKPIRRVAKHVIFEGADSLPNGHYGTSQLLSWAADKNKGMLLGDEALQLCCLSSQTMAFH